MISCTLRAVALFAISTNAAGVLKGIATIHETPAAGTNAKIRGELIFTQRKGTGNTAIVDVKGTLTGVPDGVHGFHVHQYGDESLSRDGKGRYGSHFVPKCQSLPPPDCGFGKTCPPQKDECALMEIHGLPPDEIRQAGDMGNIVVQKGQVTTSIPAAILEVKTGFRENKMTLENKESSILGRAVAIHLYQDIGRQVPLYDNLCAKTCGVDPAGTDKVPPGRTTCAQTSGPAKIADIGIQSTGAKFSVTSAKFSEINTNTKNVVVRYPSLSKVVWYRVSKVISKPTAQVGNFQLQFDNANACARRISGKYVNNPDLLIADPFGGAGPAIAGGIVGRMNPNQANDGKTSTGDTDDTKPAKGTSMISCYLRATTDAGDSKIEGEALIVQGTGTKEVLLRCRLKHGKNMAGKKYSFHFHDYGDLRRLSPANGDLRRVGNIYKENQPDDILTLKTLEIPEGKTETVLLEKYTLPDGVQSVQEYVGRSLTIHKGETKQTPTVAYGVCGLANPLSNENFYTTPPVSYAPKTTVETDNAVALGISVTTLLAIFFW